MKQKNLIEVNIENDYKNYIFNLLANQHTKALLVQMDRLKNKICEIKDKNEYTNYITLIKDVLKKLKLYLSSQELKKFINHPSEDGYTALHFSSLRGNLDIIKLLIENGADVYKKNNEGLNVLHMSVKGNQLSTFAYLKEVYNLDINKGDNLKRSPLHYAAMFGYDLILQLILSYPETNINIQDVNGQTPIHLAIIHEKEKTSKKLLQKNADLKIEDYLYSKTPEMYALLNNNQKINDLFKKRNICEILFIRPKIVKTKYKKLNSYFFIVLHILISLFSFVVLQPFINRTEINIIYLVLLIIMFSMFYVLRFSDPGKIKIDQRITKLSEIIIEIREDIKNYCPFCKVKKKEDSKHCVICDKCIEDFDHHCFWVNNCIGKNNYIKFVCFLFILICNTSFNIYICFHSILLI